MPILLKYINGRYLLSKSKIVKITFIVFNAKDIQIDIPIPLASSIRGTNMSAEQANSNIN